MLFGHVFFFLFGDKLSTSGGNIITHGFAEGVGDPFISKYFLKCFESIRLRTGVCGGGSIIWNEIHLDVADTVYKVGKLTGSFLTVIYTGKHDVFKGEVMISRSEFLQIVFCPYSELGKEIFVGGGHDVVAGNSVGAVKRNGETCVRPFRIVYKVFKSW